MKHFLHISIYVSSLSVTPFYFQGFESSLLSFLWIIFQIDCFFPLHLFGLLGFYHVPSSAAHFLCLSIVFNLLCLGFPFYRTLGHSSSHLWSLPTMGGAGPVPHDGFLVGGTGAFVLVDRTGSCLSEWQFCIIQWCVLECLCASIAIPACLLVSSVGVLVLLMFWPDSSTLELAGL